MTISRRVLLGGTATLVALPRRPLRAQGGQSIRVGVLTDLSGTYGDPVGPTGVECVRQAVQEFTAGKDMRVEVLAHFFKTSQTLAWRSRGNGSITTASI